IAGVDLAMPRSSGMDAAIQILADNPATGVLLLTVHAEEHQVIAALRAGVRGYVVKTQGAAELLQAIREVWSGGIYLSARVSRVLATAYLVGGAAEVPLTPRQREVLHLIAEGQSAKQIAGTLGVSAKTAELHRARIMDKLDIRDTAGLVRYAIRNGLAAL